MLPKKDWFKVQLGRTSVEGHGIAGMSFALLACVLVVVAVFGARALVPL